MPSCFARRGGRSPCLRLGAAWAFAGLLAGCRAWPPLAPLAEAERAALAARCEAAFPRGPWEASHVIEAALPLQNQTALLGAVAAEASGGGFRSVLMSQEGLALYDATYSSGTVVAHRALPPFDRGGFGEGTVADIRLVLFRPEGPLTDAGRGDDHTPTCRYTEANGDVIELGFAGDDALTIRRLDARGRLRRAAVARGRDACAFAASIELEAPGAAGYSLHLSLIERTAPACSETSPAVAPP